MIETITSEGPQIAMERVKRFKDAYFAKKGDSLVRIWSGEWKAYWRQNGGYVDDWEVTIPGIYTLKDAYERTSHCGPEKKIFFEFLPENYRNIRPLVRYKDLEEENERLREAIGESLDRLHFFSSWDIGMMDEARETAIKILEESLAGE